MLSLPIRRRSLAAVCVTAVAAVSLISQAALVASTAPGSDVAAKQARQTHV